MSETTKTVKSKKGNMPRSEADLTTVASEVAVSWEQRPQITLLWTNVEQLNQSNAVFCSSYAEKKDIGGTRRTITQELIQINNEINVSTEKVKGYIVDLYSKKEAPTRYESFGIVKTGKVYKLPTDNDNRLLSLDQMLKGIAQYNFGERLYGEAYWTDIRERFKQAKKQASQADQKTTEHVSIKTEQKILIRKILNALINVIKGNYPDTWRDELRIWGFRKEKY